MPASSAFGPMETRARPTSRGRARCVSFRMGRQSEQTAAGPRAGACRLQRFVICVLQNTFIVALPFSLKPTVSGIAPAPVSLFSLQGRGFRLFLLRASIPDVEGKGGGMTHPCHAGKDMLQVCESDAVCPCGAKALQSWRA